tara:strand:- start:1820 stop:2152 length:333 start_codon:yes stop_codon:yes gene_type:complete
MDITLIAIALFVLLALVFLLTFLFKNINKKSFSAADGTVFTNQTDLEIYERLLEKTKPLFSVAGQKSSSQSILGFENLFLSKLTSEGFPDLKTLIKFRNQLKLLSDLINS